MSRVFSNVASCALRRWAFYAGAKDSESKRRAHEEKQTAFAAMYLANKSL